MLTSRADTPAATAAVTATKSTRTESRIFMRPSAIGVPDPTVAPDAGQLLTPPVHGQQGLHHVRVAAPAGLLGHPPVEGGDPDRLRELPPREVVGVPEAVPGLDRVLGHHVVRR